MKYNLTALRLVEKNYYGINWELPRQKFLFALLVSIHPDAIYIRINRHYESFY